VKHHQFGTWSVSNDELALVRSDFEQLCTHLTATADRGDVELNGSDFADIPDKTYLKRIEGAHRIASPRLRNDHEVGEAMQSTKIRFYAAVLRIRSYVLQLFSLVIIFLVVFLSRQFHVF
jgi:hypothetical protein